MVVRVHRRRLAAETATIGELIDELGSPGDRLWPRTRWPGLHLDRPLQQGAIGGHGPIRCVAAWHEPGRGVWFEFTAPPGFDGGHGFFVHPVDGEALLEHRLEMQVSGWAHLSWPLWYGPLHDALIEDALWRASMVAGGSGRAPRWSRRVRVLRFIARILRRSAEGG